MMKLGQSPGFHGLHMGEVWAGLMRPGSFLTATWTWVGVHEACIWAGLTTSCSLLHLNNLESCDMHQSYGLDGEIHGLCSRRLHSSMRTYRYVKQIHLSAHADRYLYPVPNSKASSP